MTGHDRAQPSRKMLRGEPGTTEHLNDLQLNLSDEIRKETLISVPTLCVGTRFDRSRGHSGRGAFLTCPHTERGDNNGENIKGQANKSRQSLR